MARARGWRLPASAIHVARPTKWGNPFSVDWYLKHHFDAAMAVRLYEAMVKGLLSVDYNRCVFVGVHRLVFPREVVMQIVADRQIWLVNVGVPPAVSPVEIVQQKLHGADLACWCPLCEKHADGLPLGVSCLSCATCHADVLLKVANA